MPLAAYDAFFGPGKGSAAKALAEMVRQYGYKEGHQVFYALLADRRKARKTYGSRRGH